MIFAEEIHAKLALGAVIRAAGGPISLFLMEGTYTHVSILLWVIAIWAIFASAGWFLIALDVCFHKKGWALIGAIVIFIASFLWNMVGMIRPDL